MPAQPYVEGIFDKYLAVTVRDRQRAAYRPLDTEARLRLIRKVGFVSADSRRNDDSTHA